MTIEILEFSQLTNILTVEGKFLAQALSNMEVQGPSGLLMCINGEEIRVGRTGIYSINHKSININSLGFVLKPTNLTSDGFEFFVINYQYEEV